MICRSIGCHLKINEDQSLWNPQEQSQHSHNVPLISDCVITSSIIGQDQHEFEKMGICLDHLKKFCYISCTAARLEDEILDDHLGQPSIEALINRITNLVDKSDTRSQVCFMKRVLPFTNWPLLVDPRLASMLGCDGWLFSLTNIHPSLVVPPNHTDKVRSELCSKAFQVLKLGSIIVSIYVGFFNNFLLHC